MSTKNHALIFGSSGISGWALVKECLSYPTPGTFSKITALSNRSLSTVDTQWPNDSRLQLDSGIDLTGPVDIVIETLKEKVEGIETVTHVFLLVYLDPGEDKQALVNANTTLIRTAVNAVQVVSPCVKSFILQTGGKVYGLERPDAVKITTPLKESYPRIPKPIADEIFYYSQYDVLDSLSKGASWTFTEIRPDAMIGFVPGTNVMNLAQGLAFYLSLYRQVRGAGAEVPFPGAEHGYRHKHTDTFQDIAARMEIYAALNPEKCGNGKVFNIANGDVVTWADKWARICAYFGLKGVAPKDTFEAPSEFVKKNINVWNDLTQKKDLKPSQPESYYWPFLDVMMNKAFFDRDYDLSAARAVGFNETIDTVQAYHIAFDRMRAARVIP
ncbi:hypothetical protein PV08_11033 [Exophiala spinifera]|uniref:PRISE-like Rossmann-fold domain-containing protein n=1 Tax=Exophiala spinifera TaxID=91928 RepID=A0A0D2ATM7_9EURO|nr:uncharacterized protein PV08_11033 [Exophiala spinifera]KIW10073.1 hypothetical protein PV08_11033 [Exophiala spinifera]